jgi:hypothetical protein
MRPSGSAEARYCLVLIRVHRCLSMVELRDRIAAKDTAWFKYGIFTAG